MKLLVIGGLAVAMIGTAIAQPTVVNPSFEDLPLVTVPGNGPQPAGWTLHGDFDYKAFWDYTDPTVPAWCTPDGGGDCNGVNNTSGPDGFDDNNGVLTGFFNGNGVGAQDGIRFWGDQMASGGMKANGIYQVVNGFTAGKRYRISYYAVAQALYPWDSGRWGGWSLGQAVDGPDTGYRIGIDPTAGTNPNAASIQWNAVTWPTIADWAYEYKDFTATGTSATIYLQYFFKYNAYMNVGFDNVTIEQLPDLPDENGTLAGVINQLDCPTPAPVTIERLNPNTNAVLASYTVQPGAAYSIQVPAGQWKFRAKSTNDLFLSRLSGTLTVAVNGTTNFNADLPSGDSDANGAIDDGDLTNLILDFGSPQSGANGKTDFNCDGVVDDADLTVLILNFGDTAQ